MSTLDAKILLYANTTANLTASNPLLEPGRLVFETNTGKFKIGNNATYTNTTYHPHDAADITSGTLATARLASGTANGTTFLRGDQTWSAVPKDPVVWNIWAPGKMLANETIARVLITTASESTIPSGGAGSGANATVAANATTIVDIRKNGSSVGNFTWSASATTANVTISSNVTLADGDILSLVAPATPDANLTSVSYTIRGNRA